MCLTWQALYFCFLHPDLFSTEGMLVSTIRVLIVHLKKATGCYLDSQEMFIQLLGASTEKQWLGCIKGLNET